MSSVSTVIARRQRDIARREQAMLDAAQALIQRDGLLSLHMARVAEESGYAIGTLYKHFASKEDLLVTLATRERSLIPLFGSGVISIRNLDTMMRNTGDMIDAEKALAWGLVSEVVAPDALLATPKHFAAYGAVAAGMEYNTVDIAPQTLRDVHLPPFKAAVAALGGQGGGGRADMAQGGGPDGDKADEALAAVRNALEEAKAAA